MIDRVLFREGMALRPIDLADEHAYHRERQERHDACPHGSGVVLGLEVSLSRAPSAAARGAARTATVQPGVAVTDRGRTLVLRAAQTVALPRTDPWAVWLVATADDGETATATACEPDLVACDGRAVKIAAAGRNGPVTVAARLAAGTIVDPTGRVEMQVGARAVSDPDQFAIRVAAGAAPVERIGIRRTGVATIAGGLRVGTGAALRIASFGRLVFKPSEAPAPPWSAQHVRRRSATERVDALRISAGTPGDKGALDDRFVVGVWASPFKPIVSLAAGKAVTIPGTLTVRGRFRLAPLAADPSNPIFKALVLSATVLGFRQGAAEGHIGVSIEGPRLVPTGARWPGVVRITKTAAGPDPQLQTMLETIDSGVGTPIAIGGLPGSNGVWEKEIPQVWDLAAIHEISVVVTAKQDKLSITGGNEKTVEVVRSPGLTLGFPDELPVGVAAPATVTVENRAALPFEMTAVAVRLGGDGNPGPPVVAELSLHFDAHEKRDVAVTIPASDTHGSRIVEVIFSYRWDDEHEPVWRVGQTKTITFEGPVP